MRPSIRAAILKLYVEPGEPDWGVPSKLVGRRFDCGAAAVTIPEYFDSTLGNQLSNFLIAKRGWASNSIVESSHQAAWREQPKKMDVAGGAPEHFTSVKIGVYSHSANSKLRLGKVAAKAANVRFEAIAPRENWLKMMGENSATGSPVLFVAVSRRLRDHALENLRSSNYYQNNKHKINKKKNQLEIDKADDTRAAGVHKLPKYKKEALGPVAFDASDVLGPDEDSEEGEEEDDDGEDCYKGAASDALYENGLGGALVQVGLAPAPGPTCTPAPPTTGAAGTAATAAPAARKRRRVEQAGLPTPSRSATTKPARSTRSLIADSRLLLGEGPRVAPASATGKGKAKATPSKQPVRSKKSSKGKSRKTVEGTPMKSSKGKSRKTVE
jgi:hypothetical protein